MARFKFETSGNYVVFKDNVSTVCTLHNTSRAIEWRFDATGGIIFEVDQFRYQTDSMANISFDGVACDSQDDFQTGIEAMFTGYAAGGGVGYPAGTKIYMALLTQSGTDAPVATVLQNTLGGTVVWTRTNTGDYVATLAGAFPANKTWFNTPNSDEGYAAANVTIKRISDNVMNLITSGDDEMNNNSTCIQIIVYP